jgi:hypothetical protein
MADLFHWNVLGFSLALLNNLLKVCSTKLKNEILSGFSLVVLGIVNIKKLNDVPAVSKFVQNFKFTTYILPRLSGTLYCYSFLMGSIVCFEDVS